MEKSPYDFCITVPKWHMILFFVCLSVGSVGAVVVTIVYLLDSSQFAMFISLLFVSLLFVVISALGIYVGKKEKFVLQEKVFTYVKPFKKSQSAHIDDIARVEMRGGSGALLRVVFLDKEGKPLINFLDDGTSLKGNKLFSALMYYNIPIVNVYQ